MGAHGSVGQAITAQKRHSGTLLREKPKPTDPETDRQLWHRYLYRQACQYWQTLTPAQKRTWQSDAVPFHMSGFAYFMRHELDRLNNLLVCLPLDENYGSTAYDYSGNLNHGVITGASWAPGIINSCLNLDGFDDRAAIAPSASLDTLEALTLEIWFNTRDRTELQRVIQIHKALNDRLEVYILTSLLRVYNNIAGAATETIIGTVPSNDTWHFATLTISKSKLWQGQVNEQPLVSFQQARNMADMADGFGVYVGNREPANQAINGYIDEFRLYNDDITTEERHMHYLRRGSS